MLPAPRLVIGEILRELAVPVVFFFPLLSVSSLKVIEESGNVRVSFFLHFSSHMCISTSVRPRLSGRGQSRQVTNNLIRDYPQMLWTGTFEGWF